jgi:hypothetical protein
MVATSTSVSFTKYVALITQLFAGAHAARMRLPRESVQPLPKSGSMYWPYSESFTRAMISWLRRVSSRVAESAGHTLHRSPSSHGQPPTGGQV